VIAMPELRAEPLRVAIQPDRIDLDSLVREVTDTAAGAVLSFVGTVRDHKNGRRVLRIEYEAYEAMALQELRRIGAELVGRFGARRAVLVHRIGRVDPGESSVAIVLSTPHRAEGFAALRFAIETLKKDVPIWKKEHFEDGEVWVQEGS
jgi:molybdopterin synthase catalytic subunit